MARMSEDENRTRQVGGDLGLLVDRLLEDGELKDERSARTRMELGFPSWMVLEELGEFGALRALRRSSGLPLLGAEIEDLDFEVCERADPERLQAKRWAPLLDGRVAIADPFAGLPDGEMDRRPLCLTSARTIDAALATAFPEQTRAGRQRRRLGRYLLDAGAIDEESLLAALREQRANGGRIGEILLSQGALVPAALTGAIAAKIGITSLEEGARSAPLLPRDLAHTLRAVALASPEEAANMDRPEDPTEPVLVAFVEPTDEKVAQVVEQLGRPVEARVTDDEALDALLSSVYAQEDVDGVIANLQRQRPHFSAYRTGLSKAQLVVAGVLVAALVLGLAADVSLAAVVVAALGTFSYVLYTLYRLYSAWRGWRGESTVNPSDEDLASLNGRELPSYTILLPVFREKPQTMRALIEALSNLDYPKHKLNGLLLVEADDEQTQRALSEVARPSWMEVLEVPDGMPEATNRPPWLKTLLIPPGEPRTKPKAMIYGLLYARGDLLTIYDAEDKPEPDQLRKAAWAFQRADENVACIQAKLSYYNSRQNLLTRWFTLEYAAWFDLFLPGLHAMNAPIPLGGTSNHFRLDILKEALSWDPYNVTEDADLGLRFTRSGYQTQMLESTTYEEANSRFKNWLRQRSRWIKGYMQTFLVHTRAPGRLYREIGPVNCLHFFATIGGLIYTVLVSPVFWVLLCLWLLFQPGWIPGLFPGPVYYLAMASLVFGNFFFVFIALIGAVGRGQDDLAPYTLLVPVYWMMMSLAAYLALYELIRKPHYWQKTEHGLHFEQALEEELTAES